MPLSKSVFIIGSKIISLKGKMTASKKLIIIPLIFISLSNYAQYGFGIQGGFQQSVPFVMRDSFSGKPTPNVSINIYLPAYNKWHVSASLQYSQLALNHKIDASGLSWQTLGVTLGNSWTFSKTHPTKFYSGIQACYIFDFGKNSLSGGSSSGIGYASIKRSQKIVPALELGFTFKPRPLINLKISTVQPIPQTKLKGLPSLPASIKFGIEYHLTANDLKNFKIDTSDIAQEKFTKNLKNGKLYFIESGTDSSIKLLKSAVADHYKYSAYDFISANQLLEKLKEFEISPDSNTIFIVKTGNIIYSMQKPSTQGLILYDYKMENPLGEEAFFVRNLSGDALFEDPLVAKRLLKTLNKRLYKLYQSSKK